MEWKEEPAVYNVPILSLYAYIDGELPVVHVYANGVRDNARVSQGRFVPLECRVLPVHEAETLSFSWRRSDGHGLPADRLFDLVSDGSSILLYDVQVEDSSTYTCSVETGSGKTGAGSILLEGKLMGGEMNKMCVCSLDCGTCVFLSRAH